MSFIFDITIVGGGIIGVSTAYNLQIKHPQLNILLLEKEVKFAIHQTGHNSGVIHSGLYYTPGSKKADYCVRGRLRLLDFAREHRINHEVCGKVVVATKESEIPFMKKILYNGIENNLTGIEKLSKDQVKEIEPYVDCIAGIFVPQTGIINFVEVTDRLVDLITRINSNSTLLASQKVKSVRTEAGVKIISTDKKEFKTKKVIFCSGLQADRLARMDGIHLKERIIGFRGDYYELAEHARHKVKNLIYPVPNPKFPFLGVHFTRMINGDVECGPNAVLSFKREGYKKTDFNLKDTVDALTYKGTWKLFTGNLNYAMNEYRRAFSKRLFLKTLQRMIPSLTMDDLHPGKAGVRAQFVGLDGDTKEDFKIEYSENSIHVLNAPSPAATASLVIGEEITNMAEQHFKLN